jgi:hypothetical protein
MHLACRMTVEEGLRMVAGMFILISVSLSWFVSPLWLWFTVFIGVNLLQSAFTGWCPMMWLLRKVGMPVCGPAEGPARG